MLTPLVISTILLLLISLVYFLATEHLKKFKFLAEHIRQSTTTITWQSPPVDPGMYQVMLTNIPDSVTTILVGFDIKIPLIDSSGVDPFGQIHVQDGIMTFACYFNRDLVTFRFLTNATIGENRVQVTCTPEDPNNLVTPRFTPHWWQKLSGYLG